MSRNLLELRGVHTHIGAYHILHGVDLAVPQGELTLLLGRNGAGKTTALRTIMGLWHASQGAVRFADKDIPRLPTPQIAGLNIAYVPENMGIFADLTVKENMLLAARTARTAAQMDAARLEWIFKLFPAVEKFWNHPAGKLSGGQKQMVAVARAIVEPRDLLIVDEPSKGLAPAIINNMIEAFDQLKKSGVTILLVEQNIHFAQRLGDSVAGLAMGMIIFIIASGLTLVFGLMDVLNFGHGVFIALGAFVATSVLGAMGDWTGSTELWRNMVAVLPAMLVAMAVAGAVGLAFERFIVRPVYGQHLKQILITMGGMIIGEELIKVVWGPAQIPLPLPEGMRGSLLIGDAAIEKYRLVAVAVGLLVFAVLAWTLARTKVGLLIRAGVQDREMVESLGYRIRRLFVGVFVVGSALAGLGGVMWGLYQQSVIPQMGAQVNVLIFIVIIIGGLGSTGGALIGALLVGLMANYTGFLVPKVALFSNIALMVAILLWRPQGVYPVANR